MSIIETAKQNEKSCTQFLRDIIAIESISTHEKKVALRIKEEMEKLNFDKAWIDHYGNVIGQIGNGPIRVVFDGHIDTVDVGNIDNWSYHPFEGKVEDGYIYGRGAADNKAACAVQVYGAHLFKTLGDNQDKFSIFVVGSIQEEDCDGLGLKYAVKNSIGRVHYVCMGESTNLNLYRGHRGRMEIKVTAKGKSCHGSAPERGVNAIYLMSKLISELEVLNQELPTDEFLGKGSLAVSHIKCDTPSLCAVPDGCEIHIDRRLTGGETKESAIKEIESLPSFNRDFMNVSIPHYETPSYKGMALSAECYFPTWTLPEEHLLVKAGVKAATIARKGENPKVSCWVFSTNGVSTMGELGIPTIGFGPAKEEDAHTVNDRVKIKDLISSMIFYGTLPEKINILLENRE